jgi:S-methylmethionine-dependent homocysteine/selenocysteine methylase
MDLPQLRGRPMVTDGGMETDLIFHHGVDLPLFAAFPLVDSMQGRSLLTGYYDEYAAIARRAGAGLMLESATWRANPDWGGRLGYSPADLARVNRDAIGMLAELRELPGQLRPPGARGGGPGRTGLLAGADLRRALQRVHPEPRRAGRRRPAASRG